MSNFTKGRASHDILSQPQVVQTAADFAAREGDRFDEEDRARRYGVFARLRARRETQVPLPAVFDRLRRMPKGFAMTFEEAMSAAVDGDRVRANDMQPGSYVDYHFNGWRRNFAGGASSGFTPTELDRAAEWSIFEPEPAPAVGKWGVPLPNSVVVSTRPAIDDDIPAPVERFEASWGTAGGGKTADRNKWGQPQ